MSCTDPTIISGRLSRAQSSSRTSLYSCKLLHDKKTTEDYLTQTRKNPPNNFSSENVKGAPRTSLRGAFSEHRSLFECVHDRNRPLYLRITRDKDVVCTLLDRVCTRLEAAANVSLLGNETKARGKRAAAASLGEQLRHAIIFTSPEIKVSLYFPFIAGGAASFPP